MEIFGDLLAKVAITIFIALEMYWSGRLVMFVDKHAGRHYAISLALFIIAFHLGIVGSTISTVAELAKIGR